MKKSITDYLKEDYVDGVLEDVALKNQNAKDAAEVLSKVHDIKIPAGEINYFLRRQGFATYRSYVSDVQAKHMPDIEMVPMKEKKVSRRYGACLDKYNTSTHNGSRVPRED